MNDYTAIYAALINGKRLIRKKEVQGLFALQSKLTQFQVEGV